MRVKKNVGILGLLTRGTRTELRLRPVGGHAKACRRSGSFDSHSEPYTPTACPSLHPCTSRRAMPAILSLLTPRMAGRGRRMRGRAIGSKGGKGCQLALGPGHAAAEARPLSLAISPGLAAGTEDRYAVATGMPAPAGRPAGRPRNRPPRRCARTRRNSRHRPRASVHSRPGRHSKHAARRMRAGSRVPRAVHRPPGPAPRSLRPPGRRSYCEEGTPWELAHADT